MSTNKKDTSKDELSENLSTPKEKRLERSETNKVIAGVAGGIGEYFEIDPTIIRLVFILLTVFGGSGILVYIIFWIIMPSANTSNTDAGNTIKTNVDEMSSKARTLAQDLRVSSGKEDSKFWWGLIIIIFGFLLLFNNFGLFDIFNFGKIWPVALVILGFLILTKKR